MVVIIVLLWIAFGVYTFGTTFAYFQQEFILTAKEQRREDYGAALMLSLIGPIGAIVAFTQSGFNKHGWRVR